MILSNSKKTHANLKSPVKGSPAKKKEVTTPIRMEDVSKAPKAIAKPILHEVAQQKKKMS